MEELAIIKTDINGDSYVVRYSNYWFRSGTVSVNQLANFCEGPDRKYVWLCRPYGLLSQLCRICHYRSKAPMRNT